MGAVGVLEVLAYWYASPVPYMPLVFLLLSGNMVSLQLLSVSRCLFPSLKAPAWGSHAVVFYFLILNIWLSCAEFSTMGLGSVLFGGLRLFLLYHCQPPCE